VSGTLFGALADELSALLYPLERAATVPGALDSMLDELGVLPDTDTSGLVAAIQAVVDEKRAIDALAAAETPSFDAIAAVLASSARAFDALRAVSRAGGPLAQLEGFARDLTDLLVGAWLTALHPVAHQVAVLLTLVELGAERPPEPGELDGSQPVRLEHSIDRVHPERLVDLLRDPAAVLRAEYGNPLATAADADAMADKLFPRVVGLLRELGVPCRYGIAPDDAAALGDSAPLLAHALAVYLDHPLHGGGETAAGAAFFISSADRGDLGLVAGPFGTLTLKRSAGPFTVTVDLSAGVQSLAYGRHGLTLLAGVGTTAVTGSIVAETPAGGKPSIAGAADGTRVEAAGVRLAIETALSEARQRLSLSADVKSLTLIVSPGDGDGFLAAVVPAQGLRAGFSGGIAWSNDQGLTLRGSAGLDTEIPVGASFAGVTVSRVHLGLHAGDGAVTAEVSAGLGLSIGPVDVAVERVGLRSMLTFRDGNLGPADLNIGFKPPSGLALTVDAGPVTGGGALVFDPDRGLYAGEMQLQFEQIAVRAVGLLTTSRSGYSLLVLVSAQFPPVQLGLGFMLVGVGGLLGIHRTVAVEALRAGLKAGALGAVLSPPDPRANPAQLVASLAGLFPPAAGRHVFAPTARIVWGSPVLITIDLALVLELPSPVRLVALGRMRALLPEERDPVVRLQVDVLGVIDFGQQTAAVDATLIDSRIAQFALTGDFALRMGWGPAPVFLLAVGGFHPRFAAPPGFPALDRVAVALASGDNPKLRLEAYLALTSNTVQFGARMDVGARAGSFSIGGFMAFDALVTLSPLAFEVDIAAKLAVKAGSHTLLSISLALTLSGPRPWHAHGRASFSILFFDVSFGFDVTIGDPTPAALPNPVDVAPLLLAALADPRAWTAQLPAGADVVTLRTLESGPAILAHPLATLQVRQRVAPLDRTLDRFGTGVPSGAQRFRITLATVGGVRATLTPLQDRFAPAQFTAMSDDQKLSAPSFEAMTSGAALGADGYTTGAPVTVSVTYEQALVTAEGIAPPSHQRLPLPLDVFAALTATTGVPGPAFALRDAA
jgi:hypothetical protein